MCPVWSNLSTLKRSNFSTLTSCVGSPEASSRGRGPHAQDGKSWYISTGPYTLSFNAPLTPIARMLDPSSGTSGTDLCPVVQGARSRAAEGEAHMRKMAQELAEFKAERGELRNQELTVRRLEDKSRAAEARLAEQVPVVPYASKGGSIQQSCLPGPQHQHTNAAAECRHPCAGCACAVDTWRLSTMRQNPGWQNRCQVCVMCCVNIPPQGQLTQHQQIPVDTKPQHQHRLDEAKGHERELHVSVLSKPGGMETAAQAKLAEQVLVVPCAVCP